MMKQQKERQSKLWIALAAVLLLIAALAGIYLKFRPQAVGGSKEITVEVVYSEEHSETFTIQTDAQYLEQAIAECEEITLEGERTAQFGLMIDAVNGIEADYNRDHAYWAIELNEAPCNYGVSQQPIRDGEQYRLVYTAVD